MKFWLIYGKQSNCVIGYRSSGTTGDQVLSWRPPAAYITMATGLRQVSLRGTQALGTDTPVPVCRIYSACWGRDVAISAVANCVVQVKWLLGNQQQYQDSKTTWNQNNFIYTNRCSQPFNSTVKKKQSQTIKKRQEIRGRAPTWCHQASIRWGQPLQRKRRQKRVRAAVIG